MCPNYFELFSSKKKGNIYWRCGEISIPTANYILLTKVSTYVGNNLLLIIIVTVIKVGSGQDVK